MSAQECAIQDMLPELQKQGKSFLSFQKELNPVMEQLIHSQVMQQIAAARLYPPPPKSQVQLVAKCFFCKSNGTAHFEFYDHYYAKK